MFQFSLNFILFSIYLLIILSLILCMYWVNKDSFFFTLLNLLLIIVTNYSIHICLKMFYFSCLKYERSLFEIGLIWMTSLLCFFSLLVPHHFCQFRFIIIVCDKIYFLFQYRIFYINFGTILVNSIESCKRYTLGYK